MLAAGQLFATDFAWYEGAAEWKSLSEVLGPTPAAAQAAPPPPPKPAASAPKSQLAGSKIEKEKDDSDKIHVTRKGELIGSYSREKAKEYFIAGTLLPTDWGWHDGMGEGWKPLNEVLELPVSAHNYQFKSTKTSSENSGSSTSITELGAKLEAQRFLRHLIKKKKKSSFTNPLVISDKVIGLICSVAFVVGTAVGAFGVVEAIGINSRVLLASENELLMQIFGFLPGVITAFVVWILLFIINEILEKLQS